MKRIIETTEESALESLLGERVTLWCEAYIYAGRLTGINDTCVRLDDAKIVYETGVLDKPGFTRAEALPGPWYVQLAKIESFGQME